MVRDDQARRWLWSVVLSSVEFEKIKAATIHKRIIQGHRGELFVSTTNHYMEKYLVGVQQIEPSTIQNLQHNLNKRHAWAAAHHARFVHLICPDKQHVQPDDYPIVPTFRFGEYFQQQVSMPLLYPLAALQQAQQQQRVYHQHDFHWNAYGELVVLEQLLTSLKGLDLEQTLNYWRACIVKRTDWVGMLAKDLTPSPTETTHTMRINHPLSADIQISSNHCKAPMGKVLYFEHQQAHSPQRVLVFGDSFAESVVRLLPVAYREVLMVRSKSFHADLADLYQPDILITSSAEGYMCRMVADEQVKPWPQWRQLAAPDHQCDAPLQALYARLDQAATSA